jgi:predicted RNA-binding protein with PIN domain
MIHAMHYLIDGHNLIGKMTDISLDDPDDEVRLIMRLRSWAAAGRKRKLTIYFDHGLPGGMDKGLSSGQVEVIFAPSRGTADSLIMNRIKRVKNPAEYTLVTSDQTIIRVAEKRRLLIMRSEKFVKRMNREREQRENDMVAEADADPPIHQDELEMWLEIFAGGSEGSPEH